jgi:hypothetical protein
MDRGKSGMTFYYGNAVKSPEVRRQVVTSFQEEIVGSAMRSYINEKERYQIKNVMISGYQEMASINLSIACEGLCLEDEVQELLDKVFGE